MPDPRQYELIYVISPDVGEDGVAALNTQVDEVVGGLGGRIEKTDNWGRRRLAYEVNNHREGTYVVSLIEGSGEIVKELNRKLRVLDSVLRHLIVRVDEDLRKAERARQRRQQRRRRPGASSPRVSSAAPVAEEPKESKGPDAPAPEPTVEVEKPKEER